MGTTRIRPGLYAGAAGVLAAGLTLGVAHLSAAFVHPRSSPVAAVGAAFINATPAWLKTFAVSVFGTYDKLALIVGILVVVGGCAAGIGYVTRTHRGLGLAGVALLGVIGATAAVTREDASWAWAVPALLGAVAGAAALGWLTRVRPADSERHPALSTPAAAPDGAETSRGAAQPDRRGFLLAGVGVAAAAGATGGIGSIVSSRQFAVASSRAGITLPSPDSTAPPVPKGADLGLPHVPSFFTSNREFYRIDTALVLPHVAREDWTLRVHGMVDRELNLSYDELLRYPLIERDITLTCVSNPVGGPYASNARWLGARLDDVLRDAGIQDGADEMFARSADGWTCGTPTETVMDGRDAMLAVAMNGKPLPVERGFPVRVVVPGLYGYVSATKWLTDIEITRFATKKPYWAKRGWALKAPIETMSRIDTPTPSRNVRAGRIPIAGVAWAQHRGIERVEVRIDDGPWQEARLAPVPSKDTWRQWVHYWDAGPGEHRLQVRATDGRGRTQTRRRTPPAPDGATGWHAVTVSVA